MAFCQQLSEFLNSHPSFLDREFAEACGLPFWFARILLQRLDDLDIIQRPGFIYRVMDPDEAVAAVDALGTHTVVTVHQYPQDRPERGDLPWPEYSGALLEWMKSRERVEVETEILVDKSGLKQALRDLLGTGRVEREDLETLAAEFVPSYQVQDRLCAGHSLVAERLWNRWMDLEVITPDESVTRNRTMPENLPCLEEVLDHAMETVVKGIGLEW